MRIASLAMYDQPWLEAANDALWTAIRSRLEAAGFENLPERLDRERASDDLLRDSGLVLGQTCGYPLMTELGSAVTPVAAPRYALSGCDGAGHRSFIVVSERSNVASLDDLRGARAAINAWNSNTGMNFLRRTIAPLARQGRFFGSVSVTGSHMASLDAVAGGTADVAAIDCVTFGLAARHHPDPTRNVRILAQTAPSPALPFVTRGGASAMEVATLRRVLRDAIADPENVRAVEALSLGGVDPIERESYAVILDYETEAARLGYPKLR